MKHSLLAVLTALLFIGCGDNSMDDRNSSNFVAKDNYSPAISGTDFSLPSMLKNLKTNIFLRHAEEFDTALNTFGDAIDALALAQTSQTIQTARNNWVNLMKNWKKIQGNWAFEIKSGCCNELVEFIDQSDLVNPSKKPPSYYVPFVMAGADVRSSTRYTNIGLVEALLFMESDVNASAAAVVQDIVEVMQEKSAELLAHWQNDETFVANTGGETVDAILNQFIDNMYKNKEQRLGEPAGLTAGSGGVIDPELLEYHYSKSSASSIIARIRGLKEVYTGDNNTSDGNLGFDDYLIYKGAKTENTQILDAIDAAIASLESLEGTLNDALTDNREAVAECYAKQVALYNAVYSTLPAAMAIIPKIVEADGD